MSPKARVSWLGVRVALKARAARALWSWLGVAMGTLAMVGAAALALAGMFSAMAWMFALLCCASGSAVHVSVWQRVGAMMLWAAPGIFVTARFALRSDWALAGWGLGWGSELATRMNATLTALDQGLSSSGPRVDALARALWQGARLSWTLACLIPMAVVCGLFDAPKALWRLPRAGFLALRGRLDGLSSRSWHERVVEVLERLSSEGMSGQSGALAEREAIGEQARQARPGSKSSRL